tara:strand:- start:393 stop:674 length:282 start_codon:yes stop_codon:yes gene_type:complete
MRKTLNFNLFITTFFLIVLNIHSRHLSLDITDNQKIIMKKPIFRDILIFLVSYSACENFYLSILILILYCLFFDHFSNEKTHIGRKIFSNQII